MGCQCAKSNDKSNMNLEGTIPPAKVDMVEASKVNETANQSKCEVSKVEDSKIKKKKKKKVPNSDNFVKDFIEAVNRVRSNPAEIADKIIDSISLIRREEGKIIFDAEGKKISLNRGEDAFREIAQKMSELSPCEPLEFREDLVIPLPENPKEWKDNKKIAELFGNKKKEIADRFKDCNFILDLEISNPETSLLLQIVDDNPFQGKRRENLLNPYNKFIGVSCAKVKTKFCCYVVTAK